MHNTPPHTDPHRPLRDRLERFRETQQENSVKHPLRASLPFLCTAGIVMASVATALSCTLCYQVESQGQSLAFFREEAVYTQAVSQAETRASAILQTPYTLPQDLNVHTTLAPKEAVTSLTGVTGSLMESIPELAHLYTLSVNGVRVGAADSAEVITQALNLVKETYTTPETRSLHIDSQVDIRYEYLAAGTPTATAEELAAALLAPSPRTFPYTVQPGDTLESVTACFSMTEERFRALNPDLTLTPEAPLATSPLDETTGQEDQTPPALPAAPDTGAVDPDAAGSAEAAADPAAEQPQPAKTAEEGAVDLEALLGDQLRTPLPEGTAITIEQNCPLLEVSTVEEMTLTRDVLPPLETQEDATMFLGQQRVVQEGQAGQTEVLSRVVKRCGVPVASNDLSAVLLSEPTALIVGTGTKTLPELPDGCLFLWPVQGPITSDFGYRFIFGETNFHRGVDIAAPQGTAINAGADGVVVFSGERGTYGNLVILSHENGFLTYYAHCSKLLVQPGDIVTQGQPIAAVGSTGRSTGPHCHFEVRYQNEPIDPLLYLPGENNAPARSEVPEEEEEEKPTDEETTPPETETPTPPSEPPAVPQKPVQPQPPAEPTPPADPVVPEDPAPPATGEDPDAEEQSAAPDAPDQGTT